MITCQEAEDIAAIRALGCVEETENLQLDEHLESCKSCQISASEYMIAASLLPLSLEVITPAPALRGRILAAVYADKIHATNSPRKFSLWKNATYKVSHQVSKKNIFRTVSVVVIAAAFLFVAKPINFTSPNSPYSNPASATLTGTNWAPIATGQVSYDPKINLAVLTAKNLPAPFTLNNANGVYEVWLIPTNGNAVPAGYLTQEPGGDWEGIIKGDLHSYTAIATTLEPSGGSRNPSGYKVLSGNISNL